MTEAQWITMAVGILGCSGTLIAAIIKFAPDKPIKDNSKGCPFHTGLVSDVEHTEDAVDKLTVNVFNEIRELRTEFRESLSEQRKEIRVFCETIQAIVRKNAS
jgi:hypothetical protein